MSANGRQHGKGSGSGSAAYPAPVRALIERFAELPGIGVRSAERLAFHVLKSDEESALALAGAIEAVKKSVRHCRVCYNLSDSDVCSICSDASRDRSRVLVVEQPKDLIALEQTGMYRGLYHVLMGRLSALDGVEPEDLTIGALIERIRASEGRIEEVVLGLNPTVEGDGTGLYLAQKLGEAGVAVSRLARGLPSGGSLEFANKAVLADAILGRQSLGGGS
ncbi:MAG: recombination protein RecR [Phycisphaerales bacterium]|nr:recombination protein RecR [Phycisphaerales bacterium]